jgi:hypothetical protein
MVGRLQKAGLRVPHLFMHLVYDKGPAFWKHTSSSSVSAARQSHHHPSTPTSPESLAWSGLSIRCWIVYDMAKSTPGYVNRLCSVFRPVYTPLSTLVLDIPGDSEQTLQACDECFTTSRLDGIVSRSFSSMFISHETVLAARRDVS